MRMAIVLIGVMISGPAVAQRCPQCTAADLCIRDCARGRAVQLEIDKLRDCLGKIR